LLFEAKGLTISYQRSAPVVREASFVVEEGSCTAFIGSNGSGKSTIIKAICGLQPLTKGEIWFDGERIDLLPIHKIAQRGIVLVPEERRLFPDMSTLENLKMGAYKERSQRKVKANLEKVFTYLPRLRERMHLLAQRLSGGEQQMLAIGRALMASPRLLIMDEPSFGLSPVLVAEIKRIIREIKANERMTILVAEQNARMAFSIGEYCYVLESGSITHEGDTADLLQDERVRDAYLGA
jgi:branched-chain amino acid transport system ATP-binding protein